MRRSGSSPRPPSGFPFPAFLVWVVALSILFTWIYTATQASLLLMILTHAATKALPGTVERSSRGVARVGSRCRPHLLVIVPQVVLSVLLVTVRVWPTGPT
jgi:membrane protease YdiL (CAAX protease family)